MTAGAPSRRRSLLDLLVAGAMLATAGVVVWNNWPQQAPGPPLPSEPVSIRGAATIGNPQAKIAIIQYSEFQCPFCARFAAETLPGLKREFLDTGTAFLAFRHFPPQKNHPFARRAAEASACAAAQS